MIATLMGSLFVIVVFFVVMALFLHFVPIGLWISAMAAGSSVGIFTLVGMRLRRVPPAQIVLPLINAMCPSRIEPRALRFSGTVGLCCCGGGLAWLVAVALGAARAVLPAIMVAAMALTVAIIFVFIVLLLSDRDEHRLANACKPAVLAL